MTDKEKADIEAKRGMLRMQSYLPADFGSAVIAVTPHGEIVFKSNMTPEVVAYTLAKLTEEAVKQIDAPILEESHG